MGKEEGAEVNVADNIKGGLCDHMNCYKSPDCIVFATSHSPLPLPPKTTQIIFSDNIYHIGPTTLYTLLT